MALAGKVLERKGCPLHYWEDGDKDQPLVVLIHGACVDHHSKANFITLWSGIVRCLHAEPDYVIHAPLLLMHGDNDTAGDIKKICPLWAARTPGCQYVVIPDAGHMATFDNPEFINQKLLEFLEKTVPTKKP